MIVRQVQQPHEVGVHAVEHGETCCMIPQKPKRKIENEDTDAARDTPSHDLPGWLEEFTSECMGRRSFSIRRRTRKHLTLHQEPSRKVISGEHSVFTHFPKDRNCEACKRTEMTRAPCRRRTGNAELRAEKFGDLITADQKVLNEEGESRHNPRYAVVVQDLATHWIQSYPCKL